MIRKSVLLKSLTAAALLAVTSASHAAITVYTTLAAFTAATTAQGTDTFSDMLVAQPASGPMTRSAGLYSYVANATPAGTLFGAGTGSNPSLTSNDAGDSIVFSNFTGGATAAGGNFFVTDLDGLLTAGQVTVTATDSGGTFTQTISSAPGASFLGFTSTTGVTRLAVSSVVSGLGSVWPTVDNLVLAGTVATAVPEADTLALMLAGLGLLGVVAHRRHA